MHWQFGGNFGPVLKACEYRWMECSYALAHYIWFEVVTDVADSLANELTLWRILAVILIFMTIIHLLYWKKQWIKEINAANETLKKIEFKVQDLELKINILTYKAQYDTWPLSQLVTVNNESDSEDNLSMYPKLNEQRAYLKYFLARTKRKRIENKALMYSMEPRPILNEMNICDVKTNCISSNFNEKLIQQTNYIEKELSLTSLKEKRIKTEQPCDKELKSNLTTNLSEEPIAEENLKFYRSSSDSSLNDHLRSTYLGSKKITKINVKPGKLLHRKRISPEIAEKQLKFSVSSTNNISSSKDILLPKFLKRNCHSSHQHNNSKEETHETLRQVKEKLQCLHSTLPNYSDNFESNTLNISQSLSKKSDTFKKSNNNYDCIKNQQGDCNYDKCTSLKKSIDSRDTLKSEKSEVIKAVKTSKITSQSNGKSKKENNLNINKTKDKSIDSNDNRQISLVETFNGNDSDDKSLSALIQEALKFKHELMLQIEARRERDEMNTQTNRNQNDSGDYLNWNSDSDFEPNSLDKITEESSASSVADKKSKTHILITTENCNNQNKSNDNISLISQHSANRLIKNTISNIKINSNEVLLKDSEKQNQGIPDTSLQNSEEICHSNLNENLKIDSNIRPLSDTSSDTSVNRLLDRLIESERKCKSAKSLTNSKIKEDAVDPLNTFIIPHTFFDNAPFESKQTSLPVEEYGVEEHYTNKIGSAIPSYKNKNFDSSLNANETQESETIQVVCDVKRVKSKQNDEDNSFKYNTRKLNTSEVKDNEMSVSLLHKYDSHSMDDQQFNMDTYLNDDNITTLSRNIDDPTNAVKSMSELQNNEKKNKNIINKKDAGDFYSDSEITAQKTSNSEKSIFPSGDSNLRELNTLSKSAVKLKSNLYHSFCKGQTDNNLTEFKNSEQCSTKAQKNSNTNLIQKPSLKTNFELGNSKQLKAKSNLNLSAMEHVNAHNHRRSKSQVISCDVLMLNQNKRVESETIPIQLDTEFENHETEMEEKENVCTVLEVYKKSYSKPCTPQSSRNCSNDVEIQFQRKEFSSSSRSSKLSSKSSTPVSKGSSEESNCNKNKIKRKLSNESVNCKSAKSCMPILKTSLELVIIDDNEFQPKSASTRSLKTNTGYCEPEKTFNCVEENIEKREQNITELIEAKNVIFTNSSGAFELEYCSNSHDYVASYINTMMDDEQINTNPNNEKQIFYEYGSQLVERASNKNQINPEFKKDKETSSIPAQDMLLDSLGNHDDDLTYAIYPDTSSVEVQSTSSRVLSSKDSKGTEVLAKPCTLDSSTSMSDISSLTNASNSNENELKILENKTNELQVSEVSKQVATEEYDTLLQLINDHPDVENLLNLDLQK